MKHAVTLACAVALSLLCGGASAQLAYTAKTVNMRAGPARDYPIVVVLPAGLQIAVQGCLSDYRWCDVVAGPNRGWVFAGNINYAYQDQYRPLPAWGPVIGLTVLGFVFADYWDRHYVERPWYRERHRWERVPPPPPRQWRPPPHALPPSRWAPPDVQPPPSGWAPPRAQAPAARPAPRSPYQPAVPPPSRQPGVAPPHRAPRGDAAPAPRPRPQPQPGAVPVPKAQPQPGAAPPRRQRPDNSGRGQPQNP